MDEVCKNCGHAKARHNLTCSSMPGTIIKSFQLPSESGNIIGTGCGLKTVCGQIVDEVVCGCHNGEFEKVTAPVAAKDLLVQEEKAVADERA